MLDKNYILQTYSITDSLNLTNYYLYYGWNYLIIRFTGVYL